MTTGSPGYWLWHTNALCDLSKRDLTIRWSSWQLTVDTFRGNTCVHEAKSERIIKYCVNWWKLSREMISCRAELQQLQLAHTIDMDITTYITKYIFISMAWTTWSIFRSFHVVQNFSFSSHGSRAVLQRSTSSFAVTVHLPHGDSRRPVPDRHWRNADRSTGWMQRRLSRTTQTIPQYGLEACRHLYRYLGYCRRYCMDMLLFLVLVQDGPDFALISFGRSITWIDLRFRFTVQKCRPVDQPINTSYVWCQCLILLRVLIFESGPD